ncbi:hypothetical protein BB561_001392 [Smittium simulii]|uniref:LYC1 C-terminal domain-containing protein n=1 Tax=Smittium simulii TaxID=133385 RepID=A0A2T9YUV5_9FUNG|nr:hypothetical protein BB561_001392 [Smittium simulii]
MNTNCKHDDSEYGLYQAISEEQKLRTWEATSDEWGLPFMSVQDYVAREKIQSNSNFTRNNITYWLYGKKAEFEKDPATLNFVSHAETYDRKAILRKANTSEVTDITCKGVASVFCRHEHRKKGHGKAMMSELYQKLSQISGISNLYSDIGDTFYSSLGWDVYPYLVVEIPTFSQKNTTIINSTKSDSVSLMDKDMARRFITADAIVARQELEEAPVAEHARFMILPTADTLDWRWIRDEYEGVQILKVQGFPNVFGAFNNSGIGNIDDVLNTILSSKSPNDIPASSLLPSFIIWTPRYRKQKIRILRARFNSAQDIKPLLDVAIAEANRLNLPKVVLWNADKAFHTTLKSQLDAEFVVLKDNLPSVATFFENNKNCEWLLNENYCWN